MRETLTQYNDAELKALIAEANKILDERDKQRKDEAMKRIRAMAAEVGLAVELKGPKPRTEETAMRSNRNLIMQAVTTPPSWRCPCCGTEPTGFKWVDGETLTLEGAPPSCDAAMMWGTCQACGEALYRLEVGIIADRSGDQFFMDHCWKAERTRLYAMASKALPRPWHLIEHRNAAGVSVIDATGDMTERHIPLLDVHVLEAWTADGRPAAFRKARSLAETVIACFGQGRATA